LPFSLLCFLTGAFATIGICLRQATAASVVIASEAKQSNPHFPCRAMDRSAALAMTLTGRVLQHTHRRAILASTR
jgi:hypothetical protein